MFSLENRDEIMFRITEKKGLESGFTRKLEAGTYTVGRSSDCDIRLKAPDVSRQHVTLVVSEHEVTAEPFSGKKCMLEDRLITGSARLVSGQKLTLGRNTVLFFEEYDEDFAAADDELDDDEAVTQPGVLLSRMPTEQSVGAPEPDPEPDPESEPESRAASPVDVTLPSPDEGGADAVDAVKQDEPAPAPVQEEPEGDLLLASSAADDGDPEEPMSGFVDFWGDGDGEDDDDELRSMVSLPPSVVPKDPGYEPPADSVFRPRSDPAAVVDESGGDDEESHTQRLSPEAVDYLRTLHERKAMRRRIIIVAVVAVLLGIIAFIIIRVL